MNNTTKQPLQQRLEQKWTTGCPIEKSWKIHLA